MLAHQPLGPRTGAPRLVLAHGFTQNARCWGPFGRECSASFDITAVDAPGHGQSGHDDAKLVDAGGLIMQAGGGAHYLGYSMGGRMLLHAALTDTNSLMRSLILIGATAGIENDDDRITRQRDDYALADRIISLGTEAFIDEWLANPMFAGLTAEQSCRSKRLENSPYGLAASLRNCGTGSQSPLWSHLPRLQIPVLIIAGANDKKFTELGTRMVNAIGANARFLAIPGGHAVHLENPSVTAQVVGSWGEQLGY